MVGSIFGVFGTLLHQWIDRRKRKNTFKEGLYAEFKEVIPQLVGTYYLLKSTLGELDRSVVAWTHSMFSKSPEGHEKLLELIEGLLTKTDKELRSLGLAKRMPKVKTTSVKRIMLPFLQQNVSTISLLDPKLQRSIVAIQRNTSSLNQEIDLYYFYFKRTFDSTLSEKNHCILHRNIAQSSWAIAGLSHKVAKLISQIFADLSE